MTANEAPSNIIISFVKCTILYLFWYQYEISFCPLTSAVTQKIENVRHGYTINTYNK